MQPGLGFVVALKGAEPFVGAVLFQFGSKAIGKFVALDEPIQELRGNNLVMSQAIRLRAEYHVETLHFGRSSLSSEGLRRLKQS